MVDNNVLEEGKDHDEIGLWGFDFNLFDGDKEGDVREGLSKYTYLLMLINIWTRDWNNQLESMTMKVDKDYGKSAGMANGKA